MAGSRIEDWPEGLTPGHVKALIAAGYSPGTIKQATVQDLLRIDGIGEKAVKIITGVDLSKTRLDVPPAVRTVQSVTRFLPARLLWPRIAEAIGDEPDTDRMNDLYQRWVAKGYNPLNYDGWLLDWYVNGAPANGAPKPIPLPTRKDQTPHGAANPTNGADERDPEPDLARRIAEARERLARVSAKLIWLSRTSRENVRLAPALFDQNLILRNLSGSIDTAQSGC